jgi:insertion element IS1 protein InsB
LRTRIKRLARQIDPRKTICFSRSIELHEKIIGTFIEKYMFYSLEASPAGNPPIAILYFHHSAECWISFT